MSDNILYKFAKDLSQLYACTRNKKIEDFFLKIAQSFEMEFENWLSRIIQTDVKSSLQAPEVLDTLVFLTKLKKSYPSGITVSDLMFDPKKSSFIPLMQSFLNISTSQDFAVLSPFKVLLESTRNMSITGGDPINESNYLSSLKTLDTMFRDHVERITNKPYDDAPVSKRKITKKEKFANLLHYLTRRFSEEISLAYEEIGELDTLGIATNPNILADPIKIVGELFPDYPSSSMSYMANLARSIVKKISSYTEMEYRDYVYNYIRSEIMLHAAKISYDDMAMFLYQYSLKFRTKANEDINESDETQAFNIDPTIWKEAYSLILLSCVLYILGTKSA